MTIKIVYYAYLISDKWESIVSEQLEFLKSCGIYDDAKNIYMCVSGNELEIQNFEEYIKKYSKVEVAEKSTDNFYEYIGIKKVYDISKNDDDEYILYFHTKGITHQNVDKATMTRQLMMISTIENYKEIVSKFSTDRRIDIVGSLPHAHGFMYNTFFWVRSSYVKINLKEPVVSNDRYIWEIWTGIEYSRKKRITTYSPLIGYMQIHNKKELHPLWILLESVYGSKLNKKLHKSKF